MRLLSMIMVYLCGAFAVPNAGVCPKFECSDKIADQDPKVGRKCADYNTTTNIVGVQSCESNTLFCPINVSNIKAVG